MKKVISFCIILLFCVSLAGNSFAATPQEKLDRMHSYVSGELIKIQKAMDKIVEVEDPPPPPSPPIDNITLLKSKHRGFYNFRPKEIKYFKFRAKITSCTRPIQVSNTLQSNQPRTVHLLIKRGSKPSLKDFVRTWQMAPSLYDCRLKKWIPEKRNAENLYFKYNTGPQAEFVEIGEPMKTDMFYIMLYNKGSKSVRSQRLLLYYW